MHKRKYFFRYDSVTVKFGRVQRNVRIDWGESFPIYFRNVNESASNVNGLFDLNFNSHHSPFTHEFDKYFTDHQFQLIVLLLSTVSVQMPRALEQKLYFSTILTTVPIDSLSFADI